MVGGRPPPSAFAASPVFASPLTHPRLRHTSIMSLDDETHGMAFRNSVGALGSLLFLVTWPWIVHAATTLVKPNGAAQAPFFVTNLADKLHVLKKLASRLLVAAGCGAIIGIERKAMDRPAGLRSMTLVSSGSALYTLACIFGIEGGDPIRAAAQVCTGVGFIGAGVLTKGNMVRGVTTACAVWVSAAIGVCAASGLHLFSLYSCGLTVAILRISRWCASTCHHERKVDTYQLTPIPPPVFFLSTLRSTQLFDLGFGEDPESRADRLHGK